MHVIFSDSSVFSAFNMIRALRRNEILAIQIDRGNGAPNSAVKRVEFFGAEAPFQEGPFQLARLSGAPLVPVVTLRRGRRHYEIVLGEPRWVDREVAGDAERALRETVGFSSVRSASTRSSGSGSRRSDAVSHSAAIADAARAGALRVAVQPANLPRHAADVWHDGAGDGPPRRASIHHLPGNMKGDVLLQLIDRLEVSLLACRRPGRNQGVARSARREPRTHAHHRPRLLAKWQRCLLASEATPS